MHGFRLRSRPLGLAACRSPTPFAWSNLVLGRLRHCTKLLGLHLAAPADNRRSHAGHTGGHGQPRLHLLAQLDGNLTRGRSQRACPATRRTLGHSLLYLSRRRPVPAACSRRLLGLPVRHGRWPAGQSAAGASRQPGQQQPGSRLQTAAGARALPQPRRQLGAPLAARPSWRRKKDTECSDRTLARLGPDTIARRSRRSACRRPRRTQRPITRPTLRSALAKCPAHARRSLDDGDWDVRNGRPEQYDS